VCVVFREPSGVIFARAIQLPCSCHAATVQLPCSYRADTAYSKALKPTPGTPSPQRRWAWRRRWERQQSAHSSAPCRVCSHRRPCAWAPAWKRQAWGIIISLPWGGGGRDRTWTACARAAFAAFRLCTTVYNVIDLGILALALGTLALAAPATCAAALLPLRLVRVSGWVGVERTCACEAASPIPRASATYGARSSSSYYSLAI
jgi:hypothetical protein